MYNDNEQDEYPNLKSISSILKLLAVIILIASVVGVIYGIILMNDKEYDTGSMYGVIKANGLGRETGLSLIIESIIMGVTIPLLFYAFAELIHLFIKMELNTRQISRNIYTDTANSEQQLKVNFTGIDKTAYEEWKKEHPKGTQNDFYATIRKKT